MSKSLGTTVSLRDSHIVHVAIRGTAIVNGEAIAPVRTICGRALGNAFRGVVARGPRISCLRCAREFFGSDRAVRDAAKHKLYDGPLP